MKSTGMHQGSTGKSSSIASLFGALMILLLLAGGLLSLGGARVRAERSEKTTSAVAPTRSVEQTSVAQTAKSEQASSENDHLDLQLD